MNSACKICRRYNKICKGAEKTDFKDPHNCEGFRRINIKDYHTDGSFDGPFFPDKQGLFITNDKTGTYYVLGSIPVQVLEKYGNSYIVRYLENVKTAPSRDYPIAKKGEVRTIVSAALHKNQWRKRI